MKSPAVYVALVLVQVFFATLPIAVKVALRDVSSPALALMRVSGAAILFFALQRLTGGARIRSRADYLRLALYSFFGVIANQLLYITALTMTTATAAQTLVAAGPAMTLLAAIVLGHEKASPLKWAGIGLAGAGALMLVGIGVGEGRALGNLLVVGNVAAYSIYLVIARDILRRYDALTVITWVFVFGAAGIAPWGIVPAVREIGGMQPITWAVLAWIIVIPTVAAYYLNVWALARAEASLVSTFVYLQPMLTALLAIPLLHERPSARMIPAAMLIFAGVAVAIHAGRIAARTAGQVSPAGQEG